MRIGIDLDEVLYPFIDAARVYIIQELGWKSSDLPEPEVWDFATTWGFTNEGFRRLMNSAADHQKLWNRAAAYQGSEDALGMLRNAGHTIHIVTARDYGTTPVSKYADTLDWLSAENIPFDHLHFTKDKHLIDLDVLVDDSVKNLQAFSEVAGDGEHHAIAMHRAWNLEWPGDRIGDISQLPDLIRERVGGVPF